jgi:LysR family transcriptional regulator, transcriptional activator of the cysJI operon
VVEMALPKVEMKMKDLTVSMELDSTEGLLSAVEAGLGITFVSRWAVLCQLSLGTLKIARVHGLKLSRRFSMAYAAGPEPTGIGGIFRTFFLPQAMQNGAKKDTENKGHIGATESSIRRLTASVVANRASHSSTFAR